MPSELLIGQPTVAPSEIPIKPTRIDPADSTRTMSTDTTSVNPSKFPIRDLRTHSKKFPRSQTSLETDAFKQGIEE